MLASEGGFSNTTTLTQHWSTDAYIHSIGIGTVPPTAMAVSEMAYVLQFHQSQVI